MPLAKFPHGVELKLFRIAVATDSTELIVTNDDRSSLAAAVPAAQGLGCFPLENPQALRELAQTGFSS